VHTAVFLRYWRYWNNPIWLEWIIERFSFHTSLQSPSFLRSWHEIHPLETALKVLFVSKFHSNSLHNSIDYQWFPTFWSFLYILASQIHSPFCQTVSLYSNDFQSICFITDLLFVQIWWFPIFDSEHSWSWSHNFSQLIIKFVTGMLFFSFLQW
jgi:hypothetical protein